MQKMLQLRLNDDYEKPVITLDECSQINCLFDTGSSMVVWCSTSESLLQIFRDAVPTGLKTLLSGFGGNGEFVDVYKIPFMSIASRGDAINFRNVHVAVLNRIRFGFDFILPAVMFSKTDYRINNCCANRNLQIFTSRDTFSFKVKMRKFTSKEAAFLKEKLGLDIPTDLQALDGVACLASDGSFVS